MEGDLIIMACNTCGHTMQAILTEEKYKVYWCPRCGGLKAISGADVISPMNPNGPHIENSPTIWGKNIFDAARLDEVKEDVVMEERDVYAKFRVVYQNMENEKSIGIEMVKCYQE